MRVVAERLHGINYLLRVVEQEYGDPYSLSVVADVSDDETEVELKGIDKPMLLTDARALNQWVKDNGFKTLIKQRNGRTLRVKRNG